MSRNDYRRRLPTRWRQLIRKENLWVQSLAARAQTDVLAEGVPRERNVPRRLAKEDGEEDVTVVVHAQEHPDDQQEFCVIVTTPTHTRKAAVNWDP